MPCVGRRASSSSGAVSEDNGPFGVLEVDSSDPGQFDQADADFLYGFAGLLGIAISMLTPCFKRRWTTKPCSLASGACGGAVNGVARGVAHLQLRQTIFCDDS